MKINWMENKYRKGKLVLISYKDSSSRTHTIRLGRTLTAGAERMIVLDIKTGDFIYFKDLRSIYHPKTNKTVYVFKDLEELADLINGDYRFDMKDQREYKEYYSELKKYLYGK